MTEEARIAEEGRPLGETEGDASFAPDSTAIAIAARRQRRTTAFLIAALLAMLLMLAALVAFYLRISTPLRDEIAVESGDGVEMHVLQEIYGFGPDAAEQLKRPHDVNVGPDGDLYVADSQNARVLRLSPSGDLRAVFQGTREFAEGEMDMPNGVAAGPDGRVYVADGGSSGPHGKLMILSPDMKKVESEVYFEPKDPPITPRVIGEELYVTSRMGVSVFDLDGALLRQWGGEYGKAEEEFASPNGITRLSDGRIVVAESNNRRVKFYDSRGELLSVVGEPPKDMKDHSPSSFDLPMGIAADENDLLYLADAFAYQIRVLDRDGKEIAAAGDFGSAEGQLNAPGGIVHAGDGVFWVADELNHRLVKFRLELPDEVLPDGARGKQGPSLSTPTSWIGPWCVWSVPAALLLLAVVYAVTRARRRGTSTAA